MKKLLVALTAVTIGLSGCTTDPYTGQTKIAYTAKGAGIGAVAGAGVGLLTGKNAKQRRNNALVGAGVGMAAGGGVGLYMDDQAAKLRKELQGAGVQIKREGDNIRLIMPGNITFATNSTDVNSGFYSTLDAVAKVLIEYKNTAVNVIGHTDNTGGWQYNKTLSENRARSVAGYLISRKVQEARFLISGMGPDQPIANNGTAAGRERNRRVEITIEPIVK